MVHKTHMELLYNIQVVHVEIAIDHFSAEDLRNCRGGHRAARTTLSEPSFIEMTSSQRPRTVRGLQVRATCSVLSSSTLCN